MGRQAREGAVVQEGSFDHNVFGMEGTKGRCFLVKIRSLSVKLHIEREKRDGILKGVKLQLQIGNWIESNQKYSLHFRLLISLAGSHTVPPFPLEIADRGRMRC